MTKTVVIKPRVEFEAFTPATWRGTGNRLSKGADSLYVSFDLPNGTVVRLKLDKESAKAVRETFAYGYDGTLPAPPPPATEPHGPDRREDFAGRVPRR